MPPPCLNLRPNTKSSPKLSRLNSRRHREKRRTGENLLTNWLLRLLRNPRSILLQGLARPGAGFTSIYPQSWGLLFKISLAPTGLTPDAFFPLKDFETTTPAVGCVLSLTNQSQRYCHIRRSWQLAGSCSNIHQLGRDARSRLSYWSTQVSVSDTTAYRTPWKAEGG